VLLPAEFSVWVGKAEMLESGMTRGRLCPGNRWLALIAIGWLFLCTAPLYAQALNWEGQSGIFVTPFAYVPPTTGKSIGLPIVAYHYLDGGSVLGGFQQLSITAVAMQRIEFGYTRDFHQSGNTPGVSNLWGDGFNAFHAKVNVLPENIGGMRWVPATSVGVIVRTQVHNVGGMLQGKNTTNGDYYLAATKTITNIRKLPIVLTAGGKATNASLLGLAGNAPGYVGCAFGSAAFVLRGPAHSSIFLAAEALQEPKGIQGLPGAVVPTTLTYAVRIVPRGAAPSLHRGWAEQSPRLNIDLGVAQIVGRILPGTNLDARHQFAAGVSYQF
jgi:hypothetical protein